MSTPIEDLNIHPANLSDEQRKALRDLVPDAYDGEDEVADIAADGTAAGAGATTDTAAPAAGQDGQAAIQGQSDAPATTAQVPPAAAAATGTPPAAAADATAADADKGHMIPKGRFDEVLARLRAVEARDAARSAPPADRDFATERGKIDEAKNAELAALQKKWDDGDLDTDDYIKQRDAVTDKFAGQSMDLVRQEAIHAARAETHAIQQEAMTKAAAQNWSDKITAWSEQNAEFMKNSIRRDAVNKLLEQLDSDNLDDEALIAEMQSQAFEAFNWTPPAPAAAAAAATDPAKAAALARAQQNARAIASASSAPPALHTGAGESSRTVEEVNLETLKPGEFKKLPAHVQKQLLGEE